MLDTTGPNDRAVLGHNEPPEPTALETWTAHVADLRETADGLGEITNDAQREAVEATLDEVKKAATGVREAVKEGRRPHMAAAQAVTDNFKPLGKALNTMNTVLVNISADWRRKQEAARAKAAAEAKRKADEADEAARKAAAEVDTADIDAVEAAQAKADEARAAKQEAKVARATKVASGGVRMMPRHEVTIIDRKTLLLHVIENDDAALEAWLLGWADRAAKAGADDIPGVSVSRWKEPV